jgi:hypothetical protein
VNLACPEPHHAKTLSPQHTITQFVVRRLFVF